MRRSLEEYQIFKNQYDNMMDILENKPESAYQALNKLTSQFLEFVKQSSLLLPKTFRDDDNSETTLADGVARYGNLVAIKWFYKNMPEDFTSKAMEGAAGEGRLDVLIWLHENTNCGYTVEAMDRAAGNGYLEVVKYLYDIGGTCTNLAMLNAILNDHLNVAKWLHEHELNTQRYLDGVLNCAIVNGVSLDLVKWLIMDLKLCYSKTALVKAHNDGNKEIVDFLLENLTSQVLN